jgi:glycosyltransferase involved in cell wall biosynthesis
MAKKIIINANSVWNLVNFRAGLISELISHGYEVVALASRDENISRLELLGCRFINIEMENQGTNPFRELLMLWHYIRLIRIEKPNLCLFYTVKPNIFGSLASTFCGIPFINNVSGLGSVYISGGWLKELLALLYKIALRKSSKIFIQNKDDFELLLQNKIISFKLADILPGSGINLHHFSHLNVCTDKVENTSFKFLLIGRMLKDKGVFEYVNAAQILKNSGVKAEFYLLGFLDVQNPTAISNEQMNRWTNQGIIKYLGSSDDVRQHIFNANCIVLPSYREGTPRSLLEAAAMSKPIITTNVVGCKDVVIDGENGMLCEVKNSIDLASKMKDMLMLSEAQRKLMGEKGRAKMEKEYDEKIVIQKYLSAISLVLADKKVI